jgi:predicted nucleic acid-binding protein
VEIVALTHCLDACAVIAYLRKEPGAEVLKEIIERSNTFLAIHVCNLGEVYYDFFRDDGLTAARTAWADTLADAFALALAERLSIPLVTTDHHEFDAVEQKGHFRFLWLR